MLQTVTEVGIDIHVGEDLQNSDRHDKFGHVGIPPAMLVRWSLEIIVHLYEVQVHRNLVVGLSTVA